MHRLTPNSARSSRHDGASLPPRTGGGDGGRGGDDDGPDFVPNSIPNYGERLHRARMGLAVAMTPILNAVYFFHGGLPHPARIPKS